MKAPFLYLNGKTPSKRDLTNSQTSWRFWSYQSFQARSENKAWINVYFLYFLLYFILFLFRGSSLPRAWDDCFSLVLREQIEYFILSKKWSRELKSPNSREVKRDSGFENMGFVRQLWFLSDPQGRLLTKEIAMPTPKDPG